MKEYKLTMDKGFAIMGISINQIKYYNYGKIRLFGSN